MYNNYIITNLLKNFDISYILAIRLLQYNLRMCKYKDSVYYLSQGEE